MKQDWKENWDSWILHLNLSQKKKKKERKKNHITYYISQLNGCNDDRLFPEKYTVKDDISNTKLEKAIIITSKHGTRIFFPITILF